MISQNTIALCTAHLYNSFIFSILGMSGSKYFEIFFLFFTENSRDNVHFNTDKSGHFFFFFFSNFTGKNDLES